MASKTQKNRGFRSVWLVVFVLTLTLFTSIGHSEDDEDFDLDSAVSDEDTSLDTYDSPDDLDAMLDSESKVDDSKGKASDDEEFAEIDEEAGGEDDLPELAEEGAEGDELEEVDATTAKGEDTSDEDLDALMKKTDNADDRAVANEDDDLGDLDAEAEDSRDTAGTSMDFEAEEEKPSLANSDVKNLVTNLTFRMVGAKSRITASFQSTPRYQEIKNPDINQYVYTFPNTETPQRLQRAFDTTEFLSPVALFTLLQNRGSDPPSSKLIVQLREAQAPVVSVSGNDLVLEFPAAKNVELPLAAVKEKDKGTLSGDIYSGTANFQGKRLQRLEIKNSDVQDVLRLIAKTSGYNMVIGDDVKGTVGTLSLEDVPWDQAFALVLQSKKLGYVRQGNVLRVQTLEALKAEQEAALAAETSRQKVEALKTILLPVSYAKASELSARAKPFLTTRGSIDTDDRTNTLIIRDISEVVDRVQKLMIALDTQPPRVSISAKIVEMLSSFTRKLGFSKIGFKIGETDGFNIDSALNAQVNEVEQVTIKAPDFLNLDTKFEIGELENTVRTLANPTVSAVNNKTAQVNQAISFLVPDVVVVGGVATSTFKQIQANLTLNVTPIVNSDGSVFMNVSVNNDIPRGTGASLTIDSRTVKTEVLVQNGDTAVIGGIFQNTINKSKQGIPFLMRIPILGFFFTANDTKQDVKNEVVIFLTPKILNSDKAFKRNI